MSIYDRYSYSSQYPVEGWQLREPRYSLAGQLLSETLFSVGNGYIGLRGAHEEHFSGPSGTSLDGTFLNGFYESQAIRYPEAAYGLARRSQFILNVPNAKRIDLWLEDERLDLLQGLLLDYERTLDFRAGLLTRSLTWQSPLGRQIEVMSRRLVCLGERQLFALEYRVRALNFSGRVTLISIIDSAMKNVQASDDPRIGSAGSGPGLALLAAELTDDYAAMLHSTAHSGFTLVTATATNFAPAGAQPTAVACEQLPDSLEQRYTFHLAEGEELTLVKYGAYCSSRDLPSGELPEHARTLLRQARAAGFEFHRARQKAFLDDFWANADVEIDGDEALQQGIRYNLLQLLQSAGRDGKTNISAKGLTGEGYEGHYFWDSEIYIFPFFLFTNPAIARHFLEYRWQGLEQARARAREMGHAQGALFPWRTIGGEECSAYFPAGTAQYHFQADIAYAIKLYAEVTGDEAYLAGAGAEIVMETARIWMGIGTYSEKRGDCFCLNEVTGPDEYTALVDNNYFTNAMAQRHLRYAAVLADWLRDCYPDDGMRVVKAMDLRPEEPEQWRQAATRMYLPYDATLGIHPQDDTFLAKKVWDFAATPPEQYPLLLHYHPLVIYRHQVCKQADVVLALMLLGDAFTLDEKRRDFDYYERVTTHDSSLSSCIFGIVAAEIGYADKAYAYFMRTARIDLDNSQGNSEAGVHTAAMGGTWLGVAYGFAGLRVYDGLLRFAPTLPVRWTRYAFNIRFCACLLRIVVQRDDVLYHLLEGDDVTFQHRGQTVRLTQVQHSITLS